MIQYNYGDFFQFGGEVDNHIHINAVFNNYVYIYWGLHDKEDHPISWRKEYHHLPDIEEIKSDIYNLINAVTGDKITSEFIYQGIPVWLSSENQRNFSSPVNLPVRFKLGEDENGNPLYKTFETQEEYNAFSQAVADYINSCLNEAWEIKDGIDFSVYQEGIDEWKEEHK